LVSSLNLPRIDDNLFPKLVNTLASVSTTNMETTSVLSYSEIERICLELSSSNVSRKLTKIVISNK